MNYRDKQNAVFISMLFSATAPGEHIEIVQKSQMAACQAMIDANAVSKSLYQVINGVISLNPKFKKKAFAQVDAIGDYDLISSEIYNDPTKMLDWLLRGQNITTDDRQALASTIIDFIIDNSEYSQHSEIQQRLLFDAFKLLYITNLSLSFQKMMLMLSYDHKLVFIQALLDDMIKRSEPFNVDRKNHALETLESVSSGEILKTSTEE